MMDLNFSLLIGLVSIGFFSMCIGLKFLWPKPDHSATLELLIRDICDEKGALYWAIIEDLIEEYTAKTGEFVDPRVVEGVKKCVGINASDPFGFYETGEHVIPNQPKRNIFSVVR